MQLTYLNDSSWSDVQQEVRNTYATIPHKWLDDDTDEPNLYGQVVFKINGLRVRWDGEVMSVWDRDAKRFTIRAEV